MGQTDSIVTGSLEQQETGAVSIESYESLEEGVQKKLRLMGEEVPPNPSVTSKGPKWRLGPKGKQPKPSQSPDSTTIFRAGVPSTPTPSESLKKTVSEPTMSIHPGDSESYPVSSSDGDIVLTATDYVDMPDTLRVPNADIFLITSEEDEYGGKQFKTLLEQIDIRVNPDDDSSFAEVTKCKVYLLSDINTEQSKIKSIDQAIEKCTYVFLLLTKSFCNDRWADFQKDEALVRTITTEERKWGMVPLYTQPKRDAPPDKAYTIPPGLISFKGLDIHRLMRDKDSIENLHSLTDGDNYFMKGVTSMLESRIYLRLDREKRRLEEKRKWEAQKKKELKQQKLIDEHMTRLKMQSEEEKMHRIRKGLPTELPTEPVDHIIEAGWYMVIKEGYPVLLFTSKHYIFLFTFRISC